MKMKIVIFGGGAIGSLFAALLHKSGEDVALIGRKDHVKKINMGGLIIKGKCHDKIIFPSFSNVNDLKRNTDLLIITTKSYDTEIAIKKCNKLITQNTKVLSLQNGINNEEIIQKYADNVIGGVTYNGVVFQKPGEITYSSRGLTIIGNYNKRNDKFIHKVKDMFEKAGLRCKLSNSIKKELFKKFLVNTGLNGLATIANVKNRAIIKDKELNDLFTKIVSEGVEVGKSEGFCFSEDMIKQISKAIEKAEDNTNSMLQDIHKHKKTEIDSLNGKIVELGKKYDIPVPYNQFITRMMRFIEKKEISKALHRNHV